MNLFKGNYLAVILLLVISIVVGISAETPKYTVKEQEALKKLRVLAADIIATDAYYSRETFLLRWLIARDMDPYAAGKMLRNAHKWRQENRIDSILNEKILEFKHPPAEIGGHDKNFRPLVLLTPMSADLRGLILKGKRKSVIRMFDQLLERGFQTIKNITHLSPNGQSIEQCVAILDFTGFNARSHFCIPCIEIYVEFFKHFELYYPGGLKYIVLINGIRAGNPLGDIIRPLLSKSTNDALRIFGTNKGEWSKFLHSIIDKDQLPYRFGGTRKS